jgi:hypothetical protein
MNECQGKTLLSEDTKGGRRIDGPGLDVLVIALQVALVLSMTVLAVVLGW